jgi:3-phenylpropionate/trans-cinnamate dioxygenase ferredoxin reductase subunit
VLEKLPRVLARVTAPEISSFYERVHREAGVDLRTGVEIAQLELGRDRNRIEAIALGDGTTIPADIVIAGIGMIANIELAKEAGLAVSDGIAVDDEARTSDPDIFAIGDCSCRPCAGQADRMRVESVPNALDQARTAAAAICGKPRAAGSVPWFWSDQYDLKLQIAGISKGYEGVVLRGSMQERRFSVLYLSDDRLIAADTVNSPQDFNAARALISQGARIDAARLADRSVPMTALA